jgi:hypothetical protein
MTYDSQELLTLFGRLFQQRTFISAAIKSWKFDDHQQNQRGQFRVLHLLAEKDNLTNSKSLMPWIFAPAPLVPSSANWKLTN